MEPTTNVPRHSSVGISAIIESCIQTVSDLIQNNCDFDEFAPMVVNNTLPGELRSISWRLFLNIVPKGNDHVQWAKITSSSRETFDTLNSDKELEVYFHVLKNEADIDTLPAGQLTEDYKAIHTELEKISQKYDFFKSQIVGETLQRLYLIWRKNNCQQTSSPLDIQPFYILAEVFYSMYPAILHSNKDNLEIKTQEDATPRAIFYLFNNEDFFDADLYMIFAKIMENFEISKDTNSSRQKIELIRQNIIDNDNLLPLSDENKAFIATLNRFEKTAYFYLSTVNANLVKYLLSINIDPYDIVKLWISSLFTSSISFEHLTYFWDNIFLSQEKEEMMNCLCVALMNNISNELMSGNYESNQEMLKLYPEAFMNLKEIVKKALKLKEKIFEEIKSE